MEAEETLFNFLVLMDKDSIYGKILLNLKKHFAPKPETSKSMNPSAKD